jgi:hypothetical protein
VTTRRSFRPIQFHVIREIHLGRARRSFVPLLLLVAALPPASAAPSVSPSLPLSISPSPTLFVSPSLSPAPADSAAATPPPPPPRRRRPADLARIRHSVTEIDSDFSFLTGQRLSASFGSPRSTFVQLPALAASAPSSISLDTFDSGSASGSVLSSTTWAGQVTQHATSITIAGSARNDNGWAARGLNLDASGLGFITVTAQRDTGHTATSLSIQFEDRAASTNTAVFSVDASQFAFGTPTTVSIAIGTWPSLFDSTQIGGWSIGGGGLGTTDFRMTLHNLELTASAIPEPEFYAAASALAALAFAAHRRRRQPPTSESPAAPKRT